ncbi:MAG: Nif11-like leader peptide family RiPP precursor [Armatimonadota bacterium]
MSVEQTQMFLEKMKSDEAFRARVLAEEDVEARMALIGAEGFDCSAEEIAALQELGEAELSGAVGGGGGSMSAYREEHTTSMGFKWACM